MSLSDAKVRNAKPKSKPYKLTDGEGMFLLVHPNGSKYWRLKFHFAGRERILALGIYPDVSILEARERRLEARKALAAGKDPAEIKKETKRQVARRAESTFEVVAREWHKKRSHEWTPRYAKTMMTRLERDIIPPLRNRPIADIEAPEVLDVLRAIEKRGALDLAKRMMEVVGQIFMYSIATARAKRNPVPDLRGALKTPLRKHYASLKATELKEFMDDLDAYKGSLVTKLAIRFLMLTFVRTTELRGAKPEEVDIDKAEWRIPAERMKMKKPHIVPLSTQAIAVLEELQEHTGKRTYLFPNRQNPDSFMSENTMLFAIYDMGYKYRTTGHGFRSTASTILNENGFAPDVIERQLAHDERNKVRAAYNHAQHLPERRRMMQWWADHLDELAKKSTKSEN